MRPTFLRDRVGALLLAAVWGLNLLAGLVMGSTELVVLAVVAVVFCLFWAALVG